MKKRILLSLVSFFAMASMWASLPGYYYLYLTADANGKTNATATLTLNLKNTKTDVIGSWQGTVVLPEGVTYVDGSVAVVSNRYPEGYNAELTATVNEDGSVTFFCEGEDGVALTGSDGAVATFDVQIASTVEPGDFTLTVKDMTRTGIDGTIYGDPNETTEFTWTIEEGTTIAVGDVNADGSIDVADAVSVLNAMAGVAVSGNADVNGDGSVDIADFVAVLNKMAGE